MSNNKKYNYQDASGVIDDYAKQILNLEKRYHQELYEMLCSREFNEDLLSVEKEVHDLYTLYAKRWGIKNKIRVVAERLVSYHVFKRFKIKGIYPSPISSDIAIKLDDAIICVDVKTIDVKGNAGDLRATHVESNQTSFDNKNHRPIIFKSCLEKVDSKTGIPILSYVIKIVYFDDNNTFRLSRNNYPALILVCIPNGKLSGLFNYDIIENYKLYEYYDDFEKSDCYAPKIYTDDNTIKELCDSNGFTEITVDGKKLFYDPKLAVVWKKTSKSNKKCLRAISGGKTVRFVNEILKSRYDASGECWNGYSEIEIDKPIY